MDWRNHAVIALLISLLLTSCGQVGTITGGDQDFQAPVPIMDEIQPPMASKNTYPEKISIPFYEFIALNSPGQNIRVIPDDVKLEAKIKRKTLILTPIEGEWKDTTTYAVYLKRAIKDITEGNDSLMVYVFSTGNEIDSLEAAIRVVDAYTNEPLKDINVGLYLDPLLDDTSKVFPRYIALTDEEGIARFMYLKKGPFYPLAFYDDNKNNFLDSREKRGVTKNVVYGDTLVSVIPEIRLMPPPPAPFKVRSNEAVPPATWALGFNQVVKEELQITYLDVEPIGEKWNEKGDSLTVFYGQIPRSGRYKAAIKLNELEDTLVKKYMFKKPFQYKLSTNLNSGVLWLEDTLSLIIEEAIIAVDDTRLELQAKMEEDTVYTKIEVEILPGLPNEAKLLFNRKWDQLKLNLQPNAVNGYNFPQTDSLEFKFQVQKLKNVGQLEIVFDTIPPYGVLEILNKKNEVLQGVVFDKVSTVFVNNMQPGDYKFRYILDENRDGKWTTGDIFIGREPEEVIWFQEATTIRANWDVKAKLNISDYYNSSPEEEEILLNGEEE